MKQRLVGAAVLVALAVIFLPMLVQGPAPDSGVSDVPLSVPDAPASDERVRELPLVLPGGAPDGGVVGMDAHPPDSAGQDDGAAAGAGDLAPAEAGPATPLAAQAPDNEDAADLAQPPASAPGQAPVQPQTDDGPLPATTAAGDYVVGFGSFTTGAAADKVVASLRAAQLPAFREAASVDNKPVQRVRIGPYATRADAEVARQRALRVRDDVTARVVVVDADAQAAAPATGKAAKPPSPTAGAATTSKPVSATTVAAVDTGFAVQVAAFSKPADATAMRDRIRAAGFSAFTEAVATGQGTLTRVRAGPVATRAEADRLRAQVKAKLGIDGIVRPQP